MRRHSISREFFSSTALVLLLSLTLMVGVQCAMSVGYFTSERRAALTSVLDAATALSEQFTDYGSDVTRPIADEAVRVPAGV